MKSVVHLKKDKASNSPHSGVGARRRVVLVEIVYQTCDVSSVQLELDLSHNSRSLDLCPCGDKKKKFNDSRSILVNGIYWID